MGSVFLGAVFVVVCYGVSLVSQLWPLFVMLVVGTLIFGIVYYVLHYNRIDSVVRARKIGREEPIIKRITERTGYSVGADWEYYDHYQKRDVITGYTVKFEVIMNDGTREIMTCEKDSLTYNKLMKKTYQTKKQLQY